MKQGAFPFDRAARWAACCGLGLSCLAFAAPLFAKDPKPIVAAPSAEAPAAATPAGSLNFPQEFQAAMKLYYEGKTAEAQKAFLELAQRPSKNPRGPDECLARAAYCAQALKNNDEAMELAGRIKDDCLKRLCQMNILRPQGKVDAVLALVKDQDLETWPDALVFDAALLRARAYASKRDVKNAERDFLLAARSTLAANDKSFAWQFLGDLYRDACKDPQRAIEAYGEAMKAKPAMRRQVEIVTSRARLLASTGKGEQAVAELDQLAADATKDASWRCAIQICYGDVYQSLGKNAEALAKYQAAAAVQGAPEALLASARKKIEALGTPR